MVFPIPGGLHSPGTSRYPFSLIAIVLDQMIGVAFVIPLGAIMKAMGGTGWYFPPLLYSDMVPAMLEAVPDFFDMKYGFKWWRGRD